MLSKGSQIFSWDAFGRMTGLYNSGTNASYVYNGDGVRISRTINGTATSYMQDLATDLPMVMAETTDANTLRYVNGLDLIAQVDGIGPTYYHTDGLGSTRVMTDNVGVQSATYTYDAFGTVRTQNGSGNNAFSFTGEQVDPEAELVFLRSRYYDPTIGRFISRDRMAGIDKVPQSINRYVYVSNNPIMNIDRAGLMSVALEEWRGSLFFGLGASLQKSVYYDLDTGKTKEVWTAGIGGGLPGGSITYTPTGGKITTGNGPSEGFSIQTQAKAGIVTDIGVKSKLDLTNLTAEVGTSNVQVSGNGNLTVGAAWGISEEASATINFSVRKGAWEDWFYNNFTQHYVNWRYGSVIEENNRWIQEDMLRQQHWQDYINGLRYQSFGSPPSQGK